MSDPNRKRMTRLSNPVTPTVHNFSEVTPTPGKMTRLSNPVSRSVITFPTPPILFVTIQRHPEGDDAAVSALAARVIAELSRLEESLGGRGLMYDRHGSTEEPTKVVLRLFPKLIDGAAAGRVAKVADELNRLVRQARDGAAEPPAADLRTRIERELQPALSPAMMGDVEEATVA